MLYQYFIERMTRIWPLRGIHSTEIISLVDDELEVLGAQLMRTQARIEQTASGEPIQFYMPDYLFIGLSSELPDNPSNAPHHCLCIYDSPLPESYLQNTLHINLLVLHMARDVPEENMMFTLNHASFLLSDEMRFYRGLEHITATESQQLDLSAFIHLIRQLIVNPVALVDVQGRVLAFDPLYSFSLSELNIQLAAGQLSHALLTQLQNEDIYKPLKQNYLNSVHLVWEWNSPRYLIIPIHAYGLQAAWLIIQGTRTALHHSTIRLIDPITLQLTRILEQQMEEYNDRSLLHSLLFQELLRTETSQENPILRQRIAELHWQQEPGMQLLSCHGETEAFKLLLQRFPRRRWTITGTAKLLLLYPSDYEQCDLSSALEALGLRGGISWPFADLLQMRYAYLQAEAALAQPCGVLTPYSRVFAAHTATLLPQELPHFVHPAIWQLAEYDRSHEASLLNTLEAVLSSSDQLGEVAEMLFIHRSTLFYRLNRIREICKIDLGNGEQRLNLLLSLRLLQSHNLLKTQ